jgi:hypothetical protein
MSLVPLFPLFYHPTSFENVPTSVAFLFLIFQEAVMLTFIKTYAPVTGVFDERLLLVGTLLL